MKTILHAVDIDAGTGVVYRALTTEAGLAGWWSRKVSVEGGEGDVVRFTFLEDFNPVMRQTRLQPGRRVEWTCVGGHEPWADNTFVFDLEARDGSTLLLFTQTYATELSDETYGRYNFNWGYYLNSLKTLCDDGEGTPFEPD